MKKFRSALPVILQLFSRISKQGLGFVLGILIVKSQGLEIFGTYSKLFVLANLGLGAFNASFTSHYMRSKDSDSLSDNVAGILFTTLFCLIFVAPILSYLLEISYLSICLAFLTVGLMGLSDISVVRSRFNRRDIEAILVRSLPLTLIVLVLVFFEVKSFQSLLTITFISWLVVLFFFRKESLDIISSAKRIDKIFLPIIVLYISSFSTQIIGSFDQILISELLNDKMLGSYRISFSVTSLLVPIIGVFSFMYVTNFKNNEYTRHELVNIVKLQLIKNAGFGITFLLLVWFFIDPIVQYAYGLKIDGIRTTSTILASGVLFNVLNMVFSYSLLAINKDRIIFLIMIFTAIISIVLNILLINRYGLLGAAISNMLTQILSFCVYIVYFYYKSDFFNIMSH